MRPHIDGLTRKHKVSTERDGEFKLFEQVVVQDTVAGRQTDLEAKVQDKDLLVHVAVDVVPLVKIEERVSFTTVMYFKCIFVQ